MIARIGLALLVATLAAPPDEPSPAGCIKDGGDLYAEADALLAEASRDPNGPALARARERLRAARRLSPSVDRTLQGADLAFAAGDSEEGVDLLAAAAERNAGRLTPAELYLVARRAEERRRWREAIARYAALARMLDERGEDGSLIQAHLRPLILEAEAAEVAPPGAEPPVEAQLALADARRALSAGRLGEAREKLSVALHLAPTYVEALDALGAVETRAGHTSAAIRAYRAAVAADPGRVETLSALANLLWGEPDRAAKEESLAMLDRAVTLRPDLRPLMRRSAMRWAEFGDAPTALERLDRFLQNATPQEREETRALRETLARRVREASRTPETAPSKPAEPLPPEPASGAVALWQKARVLAARGDSESLATALALLAEAEAQDPSFASAPELAASIHQKRGEGDKAIASLERATEADPSRASTWEGLARALERDPRRSATAEDAWRRAAAAGSTEALFQLGEAAEKKGRRSEAIDFYRRYRDEAPAGSRAAEAAAAVARLEGQKRAAVWVFVGAVALAAIVGAVALYRRRSGRSFAEWLNEYPARAAEARPVLGRVRHEALKHGGLLLSDGAARIEAGGRESVEAARLLSTRLYGEGNSAGLIAETQGAIDELRAIASQDRVRLNLRHRDAVFSWLVKGLETLRRAHRPLERIAEEEDPPAEATRRLARILNDAARSFVLASGTEMERSLDRAAALPVRADALRALLARVAAEIGVVQPELETIGGVGVESPLPLLRMPAADWETLWRNLFSNALAPKDEPRGRPVRLGLSAQKRRDPITGEPRLRIALADDLPGALSAEQLRGRPSDRGWGVIEEVLRKNDGAFEIAPSPKGGFTKAIVLDLPALEEPA